MSVQSHHRTPSQQHPLSVEAMFGQIMTAVQKSNAEIAELRHECSELRMSNAALEKQVKEGLCGLNGSRMSSGFVTPVPSSPQLKPKSPFLPPHAPSIPQFNFLAPDFSPSSSADAGFGSYPFQNREIPGFYVVIPAGGAGTRLWPLSREGHPKFLLDLTLKRRSLIQATWDRLIPLTTAARTTIVAGPAHVQSIKDQLPDLLPENILCEPGPKDSMAAIGLAAAVIALRDPDAVIGSFAADHMISGDDAFLSAVTEAVAVAQKDYLVTIGIAPSHPSTAFGYVRLGESLRLTEDAPNARKVLNFKEKPDARTAAAYIKTGNYRWNAGMFVVKASFLMQLLSESKPELHDGLQRIASVWDESEEKRQAVLDEVWNDLEKIPIDNAIAEPAAETGRVAVVPATFGWDDVGDFSSLAELLPAEANQPRILGDSNLVLTEQVAGGIVVPGSGRLVSLLGVDDIIVVDMPDTLMVTTRARSQEVKRLVKKCKEQGWKKLL